MIGYGSRGSARRNYGGRRSVTYSGIPNPGSLTEGAVTAWLSVAAATSDVNGVSSLPDLLATVANPAVQATNARKPLIELSANGLPCMRFATSKVLTWPLVASNNNTSKTGVGFWFKPDALASFPTLASIDSSGAASVFKYAVYTNAATGGIRSDINATGIRDCDTPGSLITALTWAFFTLELDMSGAAETDRVVVTVNGTPRVVTFGGAAGPVSALTNPTGSMCLGATTTAGTNKPYNGLLGPDFYVFGAKQPGATVGLLTTAGRAALMAFNQPT